MLRKFFAKNSLFTLKEFKAYLASQGSVNPHTQTALLNYHLDKGHVIRVKRGLYATVPALFEPETVPIDPFAVASKLAPDAVIAHHAALEMHGVAYSTHYVFTYLSEHVLPPFEFRGQTFVAVKPLKCMREGKQQAFACQQMQRNGVTVTVTGLERTFVDVISKPDLGGGWEEILASFDMIAVMNIDLLIDYTLRLKNASIVSKVGYFLELYQARLGVTPVQLNRLLQHASKHKIYLERGTRAPGKLISQWNLVVPHNLINRTWEEF